MRVYLTTISFIVLFTLLSCDSKNENNSTPKVVQSTEKTDTATIIPEMSEPEENTDTAFVMLTDKYADDFFYDTLVKVETPDYDIVDKYGLTEADREDIPQKIFDKAHVDSYRAKVFLYNIENRLEYFQDFTLLITNDYSTNIVYCVLDSSNNVINALNLAYTSVEGESLEDASGEFVNKYEYHQKVVWATEGWEDPDGTISESKESINKKYFRIMQDGYIEEL